MRIVIAALLTVGLALIAGKPDPALASGGGWEGIAVVPGGARVVDQSGLGNAVFVVAITDDGQCECPNKACVPGRCNCGGAGQPACCDMTCVTICIPWDQPCCRGEEEL